MWKRATFIALALTSIVIGGCATDMAGKAPSACQGFLAASIDVNCKGGGTFTVSTGNASGTCKTTYDTQGNAQSAFCTDGLRNEAGADCTKNGGKGGCTETKGAGSCTSK